MLEKYTLEQLKEAIQEADEILATESKRLESIEPWKFQEYWGLWFYCDRMVRTRQLLTDELAKR